MPDWWLGYPIHRSFLRGVSSINDVDIMMTVIYGVVVVLRTGMTEFISVKSEHHLL